MTTGTYQQWSLSDLSAEAPLGVPLLVERVDDSKLKHLLAEEGFRLPTDLGAEQGPH